MDTEAALSSVHKSTAGDLFGLNMEPSTLSNVSISDRVKVRACLYGGRDLIVGRPLFVRSVDTLGLDETDERQSLL